MKRFLWFSVKQWLFVLAFATTLYAAASFVPANLWAFWHMPQIQPTAAGISAAVAMLSILVWLATVSWSRLSIWCTKCARLNAATLIDQLTFGAVAGLTTVVLRPANTTEPVCSLGTLNVALGLALIWRFRYLEWFLAKRISRESAVELFLDGPLSDLTEDTDAFDRIPFVHRFALLLELRTTGQSRVFGIIGGWGEGKTSILNAVEKKLDSRVVIRFESWQFRQSGRLIECLLRAIADRVCERYFVPQLKSEAIKYSQMISPSLPHGASIAARIIDAIRGTDEVEDLRRHLRTAVQLTGEQFIIFIDDVDRLLASEVHELFKAVRFCASIPNLVYVLSYDRAKLLDLVDNGNAQKAAEFLQKVVDDEVLVPRPPSQNYERYLNKHLSGFLEGCSQEMINDFVSRMNGDEARSARRLLNTPRLIKRVCLGARNRHIALQRDANAFDFFMLELLRQLRPTVYMAIRDNPELFNENHYLHVMAASIGRPDAEEEKRSKRIDGLLSASGAEADSVKHILEALFPGRQSEAQSERCLRLRRICHTHAFERFFYFDVPAYEIRESEIQDWVKAINGAKSNDEKQRICWDFLEEKAAKGAFTKALDLLEIFRQDLNQDSLRVCILTIAAHSKNYELSELMDIHHQAIWSVAKLISTTDTDADATALAVESIKTAGDIAFAGHLRLLAARDRDAFAPRIPNPAMCSQTFKERADAEYLIPQRSVLEEPTQYLQELYWNYPERNLLLTYIENLLSTNVKNYELLVIRCIRHEPDVRNGSKIVGIRSRLEMPAPAQLLSKAFDYLNSNASNITGGDKLTLDCFLKFVPAVRDNWLMQEESLISKPNHPAGATDSL